MSAEEERASHAINCFDGAVTCVSYVACLPCASLCWCGWIDYCCAHSKPSWKRAEQFMSCCCEPWIACAMAPCFCSNVATACYAKACWGVLWTNGDDYYKHMHNGYRSLKYILGGPCICAISTAYACGRMIRTHGLTCINCCCPCFYRKSENIPAPDLQAAPAWHFHGAGRVLMSAGPQPQAMVHNIPLEPNNSIEGGGDFIQPGAAAEEPHTQLEGVSV